MEPPCTSRPAAYVPARIPPSPKHTQHARTNARACPPANTNEHMHAQRHSASRISSSGLQPPTMMQPFLIIPWAGCLNGSAAARKGAAHQAPSDSCAGHAVSSRLKDQASACVRRTVGDPGASRLPLLPSSPQGWGPVWQAAHSPGSDGFANCTMIPFPSLHSSGICGRSG